MSKFFFASAVALVILAVASLGVSAALEVRQPGLVKPYTPYKIRTARTPLSSLVGAPRGPFALLDEFLRAIETKDITRLEAVLADNATVEISSWGSTPWTRQNALSAFRGYFSVADVINEEVYVQAFGDGGDCFIIGERVGSTIYKNETDPEYFALNLAAKFRMTCTPDGGKIQSIGSFSSSQYPSPQKNETETLKVVQNVYDALNKMDVDAATAAFADDFNFALIPGGVKNCNKACARQQLINFFAGISGKLFKAAVESCTVSYAKVVCDRNDFEVMKGRSPGETGAFITHVSDVIELNSEFKIKSWSWYFYQHA